MLRVTAACASAAVLCEFFLNFDSATVSAAAASPTAASGFRGTRGLLAREEVVRPWVRWMVCVGC